MSSKAGRGLTLAYSLASVLVVAGPAGAQTPTHDPAQAQSAAQTSDAGATALAQGALFEKRASEIVGRRATEASAKSIATDMGEFAQRFRAALDAAQQQASGANLAEPSLSDTQRQELDQLERVTPDQLGTRYVQAMIGALQQQREQLQATANGGQPTFRNAAQQLLPEVDRRLADLRNAQTSRPDRGSVR